MDKMYLIELVRDMPPLWDQTDKKKITITEISNQNFWINRKEIKRLTGNY
jgi:hypothetical protein